MLDTLISQVTEEIAMDGFQGASIDTVWTYVEQFATRLGDKAGLTRSPIIDHRYKSYFWEFLKHTENLEFYEDNEYTNNVDPDDSVLEATDEDSEGGNPMSDDEQLDTMVDPSLNRNCSVINNITILDYEQVEQRYGPRLRLIASPQLQTEQLHVGIPPGRTFSKNLLIVLKAILLRRAKGITQAHLTKILHLDPRSTGHYVKSLELKGAITRTGVGLKGIRTNICVHVRFGRSEPIKEAKVNSDSETVPHNVNTLGEVFSVNLLRTKMIELLRDAKDNVMYTADIMSALGFDVSQRPVRKWFHRCVDDLCLRGYFRKLDSYTSSRPRRCLKLLKTSEDPNTSSADTEEEEMMKHFPILHNPKIPEKMTVTPTLYWNLPFEYQLLNTIRHADTTGITQKDIGYALCCEESRVMFKYLEKLTSLKGKGVENYGVRRVMEYDGRIRHYRYYTYRAYMKACENKDISDTEEGDDGDSFELGNNLREEVDFRVLPRTVPPKSIKRGRPRTYDRDENDVVIGGYKHQRPKKGRPSNKAKAAETGPPVYEATHENTPIAGPSTQPALPVKRGRGRPRKTSYPAETAPSQTAHSTENTQLSSIPVPAVTHENTPIAGPSTQLALPVKRGRGRPRKTSYPAETAPSQIAHSTENTQLSSILVSPPESWPHSELEPESIPVAVPTPTPTPTPTLLPLLPGVPVPLPLPIEPSARTMIQTRRSPVRVPLYAPIARRTRARDSPIPVDREPRQRQQRSATPPPPNIPASFYNFASGESDVLPNRGLSARHTASHDTTDVSIRRSKRIRTTRDSDFHYRDISELHEAVDSPVKMESDNESTEYVASDNDAEGTPDDEGEENESEEEEDDDDDGEDIEDRNTKEEAQTKPMLSGDFKFEIQPIESLKTIKLKKKRSRDIYWEQRKQTVLALLQENPIHERGISMKRMFEEKMTELFGANRKSTAGICLKTVWRTAETLAVEGYANIAHGHCTLLNGRVFHRRLLLRKDLDPTGPEVQQYIAYLTQRKVLQPHMSKITKVDRISTPIESIEDRLQRMEADYAEAASDTRRTNHARQLEQQISKIKTNLTNVIKVAEDAPETNIRQSLLTARQLGFINSKMIRTRLLHQHLYGLIYQRHHVKEEQQSEDTGPILTDDTVILSTSMINQMELGTFLKIVGILNASQEVYDYLENMAPTSIQVSQTPFHVRAVLFNNYRNKFRFQLRNIIDFMVFLELIEPVNDLKVTTTMEMVDSPSNIAFSYRVKTNVNIYNYYADQWPVHRHYEFKDPTDVQIYWSDLQCFCYNHDTPFENIAKYIPNPSLAKFAKSLLLPRNWSTNFVYTRQMRQTLHSYIDKETGNTPYDNIPLCQEISHDIGATLTMVREYFRKVEMVLGEKRSSTALQSASHIRRRRRRRRRLEYNSDDAENESSTNETVSLSTTQVFERIPYWSVARRLVKAQKSSQTEGTSSQEIDKPYLDHERMPMLDENELGKLSVDVRHRTKWTKAEDDLLFYAYVILKARPRISWKPIADIFPSRKPTTARNRISRLKENPRVTYELSVLSIKWKQYYKEGIDSGAISDPNPLSFDQYDLVGHLTYFIERLQNDGYESSRDSQSYLPLYADIGMIETRYWPCRGRTESRYYFEDDYNRQLSVLGRQQVLCSHNFTQRLHDAQGHNDLPHKDLKEIDSVERNVEALKMLCKMILMTPQETYDPLYAFMIMNRYPGEHLSRAISELRKSGTIASGKSRRFKARHIPNTWFCISKRFRDHMASRLPVSLLEQACAFEQYLDRETRVPFMPVEAGSGMMVCILDLLAKNKIRVFMRDRTRSLSHHLIPNYKNRMLDERLIVFPMDIELVEPRPAALSIDSLRHHAQYECLTPAEFDTQLRHLRCTLDTPQQQTHLDAVIRALVKVGSEGACASTLKTETGLDNDDLEHTLSKLHNAVPPLVATAGFMTPRLVLTTDMDHWMIPVIHPSTENAKAPHKITAAPRLWIDLHGNVTVPVLRGCLQAVLGVVLDHPGITEAQVFRYLSDCLTRVEVHDLLQHMVKLGAMRQLNVARSSPTMTLFSPAASYSTSAKALFGESQRTCYWALPGAYNIL